MGHQASLPQKPDVPFGGRAPTSWARSHEWQSGGRVQITALSAPAPILLAQPPDRIQLMKTARRVGLMLRCDRCHLVVDFIKRVFGKSLCGLVLAIPDTAAGIGLTGCVREQEVDRSAGGPSKCRARILECAGARSSAAGAINH